MEYIVRHAFIPLPFQQEGPWVTFLMQPRTTRGYKYENASGGYFVQLTSSISVLVIYPLVVLGGAESSNVENSCVFRK